MSRIDNLNRGEFADILRRLRALETASPLTNAAIGRGTLDVYDAGQINVSNGGLLISGLPTTTQEPNLYVDPEGNLFRCAGTQGTQNPTIIQAQTETRNAFQTLTFLLEAKGTLNAEELAHIYAETQESGEVFRAGYENERAADDSERSHTAHTESETLANKGMQDRASDTQTGAP